MSYSLVKPASTKPKMLPRPGFAACRHKRSIEIVEVPCPTAASGLLHATPGRQSPGDGPSAPTTEQQLVFSWRSPRLPDAPADSSLRRCVSSRFDSAFGSACARNTPSKCCAGHGWLNTHRINGRCRIVLGSSMPPRELRTSIARITTIEHTDHNPHTSV